MLSKAECGRLGGLATLARFGPDHFARIQAAGDHSRGGKAIAERYGSEHFQRIGRRGGEVYVRKFLSGPSYRTPSGLSETFSEDEIPF